MTPSLSVVCSLYRSVIPVTRQVCLHESVAYLFLMWQDRLGPGIPVLGNLSLDWEFQQRLGKSLGN